MKMKRILCSVLLLAVLIGCGSNVDMVKNGYLDIDKSLTIGQAFENYKYFDSVAWKEFTTSNKREIVEVNCTYKYKNVPIYNEVPAERKPYLDKCTGTLTCQFVLNKDDSLEIIYAGNVMDDGEEKTSDDFDRELTILTLDGLYKNKPIVGLMTIEGLF